MNLVKKIALSIKTTIFYISFLTLAICLMVPLIANAADTATQPNIELQIPLLSITKVGNIAEYIKYVYKAATYIIIPITIVVIVFAGIEWLSAAGRDTDGINRAKKRMQLGLIGLGIVLLSYVLLNFVGITQLTVPGIEEIPAEEPPILEGEFENEPAGTYTTGTGAMMSSVPRLYQGNFRSVRWDGPNCPGSGRTVSSGGCGLVSSVMVLNYYGKNVTVPQAAQWTSQNGWRKCGVRGISFQGIAALAKWQGLSYRQIPKNFEAIKASVINKKPVIVLLHGPCKFTGGGHFVVLAGWDGTQFIVNDPGSHSAARTHGTWAEIAQGCSLIGAGSMGG